ncbi:uncharacterized protein EI90DRAFT_3122386 [Cantharellus anzutake]|uniref:uncharacterized protein n=1 Tax=Cantharellus anzutake TaxID=1750568 RepID=UPI0019038A1E|nr:uncharacterized protein EI90DRAFT_3122386 [Cantharellus anzutake]KAF8332641.1 hypothetical protein EI90DRAFT_3122386 [Cantharellus anzutake]
MLIFSKGPPNQKPATGVVEDKDEVVERIEGMSNDPVEEVYRMDYDDLDGCGDFEHKMMTNDISLAPTLKVISNLNLGTSNKRAKTMLMWLMKIYHTPMTMPSTDLTLTPGYSARFVAKEFSPVYQVDCEETFTPAQTYYFYGTTPRKYRLRKQQHHVEASKKPIQVEHCLVPRIVATRTMPSLYTEARTRSSLKGPSDLGPIGSKSSQRCRGLSYPCIPDPDLTSGPPPSPPESYPTAAIPILTFGPGNTPPSTPPCHLYSSSPISVRSDTHLGPNTAPLATLLLLLHPPTPLLLHNTSALPSSSYTSPVHSDTHLRT